MQRYSHNKVLSIFPDIDSDLLKSWATLGLITPDLKSKGIGIFKKYSTNNLIEIGVARELLAFGVKQIIVEPIIQSLREHLVQSQDYDLVIVCRRQYVSAPGREAGQVTEILKGKKSDFKYESDYLLFNETQVGLKPGTVAPLSTSALVICVADIWEYIMRRL